MTTLIKLHETDDHLEVEIDLSADERKQLDDAIHARMDKHHETWAHAAAQIASQILTMARKVGAESVAE